MSLLKSFPGILVFFSVCFSAVSQDGSASVQGEWNFDKLVLETNAPNGPQIQKELTGICLKFKGPGLTISKKTLAGDSLIKQGPYSIKGDTLVIGQDHAKIIELTDTKFVVRIHRDGILYLKRSAK